MAKPQMDDGQFAEMRQLMVAEIVATTVMTGEKIGKYNLDARVMAAMGRVARHEFVPTEVQPSFFELEEALNATSES